MMIDGITSSLPHVQSGKLRALGVGTAQRLAEAASLEQRQKFTEAVDFYQRILEESGGAAVFDIVSRSGDFLAISRFPLSSGVAPRK